MPQTPIFSTELDNRSLLGSPLAFSGKTLLRMTCESTLSRLHALGARPDFSLTHNLSVAACQGKIPLLHELASIIAPKDSAFFSAAVSAISLRQMESLIFLMPFCEPVFHESNSALCVAAERGFVELVQLLAPLAIAAAYEPANHTHCPLILAARYGHVECVDALLPFFRPSQNQSSALAEAASNGHAQCVQSLIPHSDPSSNFSLAICEAIENGHSHCVDLLMPSLLLLSPEAISKASDKSFWLSRSLAAERLATIALSLAESQILSEASTTDHFSSKKNARI